MGVTIYKPGEYPDDGLSFQERQLKARQERARKMEEHRVREDAFQAGQDPDAALAAFRARRDRQAQPEAPQGAKAQQPTAADQNKMAGPSALDENKASQAPAPSLERED